jgi:hypothetical protein
MQKQFLVIGGTIAATVALASGLAFFGARPKTPLTDEQIRTACVQHGGVGMHIHPYLAIKIDGEERKIPENIGIDGGCMHPIHTHDDTGVIHLEFPVTQDVSLAQFFDMWKQPLSREQILDRHMSAGDELRVTVKGTPTKELERVPLRDQDQIAIEVRKKE